MEHDEKIDNIRKRITGEPALSISRIPEKTRLAFIKFADKEFCSDRGMALKFLMDNFEGLITSGVEHIEIELGIQRERQDDLDKRISDLEKEEEKPKKTNRLG